MKRNFSVKVVSYIQEQVISELRKEYPECVLDTDISLLSVLAKINARTNEQFIIIIDEWDCLFREDKNNENLQKEYINLLRGLFKEMQRWYDGYYFEKAGHIYNPNSVINEADNGESGKFLQQVRKLRR